VEVLVQDKNHKLYLLNRAGEILWDKELEGKIISDIHQIDFYKNEKLQYLFNTQRKIYLVDRNGKSVTGYPRNLNSSAANGIAVFDYDGKKDYRFFVACKNGNIYGYEKNGRPLPGWNPLETNTAIPFPMQHFLAAKKDHLIALSKTGKVLVYKRNATTRLAPIRLGAAANSTFAYQFGHEPRGIVAVDTKGNVSHINIKGTRTKERTKVGSNTKVKFAYADIVGDKAKDYALLDGQHAALYFYNGEGKFTKFFNQEFKETQDDIFTVEMVGDTKSKIGTYSKDKKRIYLMNEKGELYADFPLAGTTRFEVVDLLEDQTNVLVVANDDVIYAYKLAE
jgi:hypothetical protein